MATLGAAFVRVSTGSQDEASQIKAIKGYAAEHDIDIIKTFRLRGYSASQGLQEPALREAIADIARGDYTTLIVTESSRLDRREDLDAQAEILLAIRSAGGDIVVTSEPQFGKTDFAGRIVTLVAQHANAEKSKTVKASTIRGMGLVMVNGAHHGPLPMLWATRGERYNKQAYCTDPAKVNDIYTRVADGESLQSVSIAYDSWPPSIKRLIRFEASYTGVVNCSYGTLRWTHEVQPVVDDGLWWRANNILNANQAKKRVNKGGRPIGQFEVTQWVSGILECPQCGGRLFVNAGHTPAGNPRTPMLRCGGYLKERRSCKKFKGVDARLVTAELATMLDGGEIEILAYQRVSGNSHELDELKASLAKLQAQLSIVDDDDELDRLVTQRRQLKAEIAGFELVPDTYAYAPTGRTLRDMWHESDDNKRRIVKAVHRTIGLDLTPVWDMDEHNILLGVLPPETVTDGIVDLGDGICFRYSDL